MPQLTYIGKPHLYPVRTLQDQKRHLLHCKVHNKAAFSEEKAALLGEIEYQLTLKGEA